MKHNIPFLLILFFIYSNEAFSSEVQQADSTTTKVVNNRIIVTQVRGDYKTEKEYYTKDTVLLSEKQFFKNKPCKNINYNAQTHTPVFIAIFDNDGSLSLQQTFSFKTGKLIKEQHYKPRTNAKGYKANLYDGLNIENFEDGKPRTRIYFQLGDTVGTREEYYYNQQLKEQAHYENGLMSGTLTEWYKNGNLKSERKYIQIEDNSYKETENDTRQGAGEVRVVRGGWCGDSYRDYRPYYPPMKMNGYSCVLDGKCNFYNQAGRLDSCKSYENDKLHGLCEIWYPNGNKKSEITYEYGIQKGPARQWYPNGVLKEEYNIYAFQKNLWPGRILYQGKRILYKPDGTVSLEENYEDGLRQGLVTEYYEEVNQPKLIREYSYGYQVGKEIHFSEKGDTLICYNHPRLPIQTLVVCPDSLGTEWDCKTNKKSRYVVERNYNHFSSFVTYIKGMPNGWYVHWNSVGNIDREGRFKILPDSSASMPDGLWYDYNYDGSGLTCKTFYKNGFECWHESYFSATGIVKQKEQQLRMYGGRSDMCTATDYYINGTLSRDYVLINARPKDCYGRVEKYYLSYYPNGKLWKFENKNAWGNVFGYQMEWTPDGKIIKFTDNTNYNTYVNVTDMVFARQIYEKYNHRPPPQGQTVDGKKEGLWLYWFDKDHKQYEENFKNGLLHGLFTAYYPNGQKICDLEMKEGFPCGKYLVYNVDGTLVYAGGFNSKGEIMDDRTEYYLNGKKEREIRSLAADSFLLTEWYENGNIKIIMTENAKQTKLNGQIKEWYPNGQLKWTTMMKKQRSDGQSVSYYENGKQESESNFEGGKQQGWNLYWNKEGTLLEKTFYKNGLPNGEHRAWYKNGKLREEGTFLNDKKVGTWNSYNEEGKLIETSRYDNNLPQ